MNFCKTTGCTLAACALASALGACGGGYFDPLEDTVTHFDLTPSAAAPGLPPLLQDDGQPSAALPQTLPTRGDEVSRSGLYALRAQAQALDRALGGDVLWLDEACCRDDVGQYDPELALGLVAGLSAARDMGRNAPVFVALDDRRMATAFANRLDGAGYTRVFVVTD